MAVTNTTNPNYADPTISKANVDTSGIPVNYSTLNAAGQTNVAGQVVQNIQDPLLPQEAVQEYTKLDTGSAYDQSLASTSGSFLQGAAPTVEAGQIDTTLAQAPTDTTASTMTDVAQIGDQGAQAEAATAQLDVNATVQKQMSDLLTGLEGGNIPDWAAPAVANVEAALAARGMSTSTIGRDALFNAITQAALPIAQQDAKAYEARQQQNVANIQQANLTNAQLRTQTLLSDQSAANAAKQFNAQSENQVKTYMAQLKTQVELQNAAQANAMSQAQAQLDTQVSQYNAQMEFNRQQFNSQMYAQLEQSNVNWRRQANTIDTAGQNAVNQANAINAFNLSNQALTWVWGDMRDAATWAFQAAESDQEYELKMALAALANEQAKDNIQLSTWQTIGTFVSNALG